MRRLLAIFPLFFFLANAQDVNFNCEGGFDIYMVMDSSNSIQDAGRNAISGFLTDVKNTYKDNAGFRMAIYSFGSVAFPVLPLSGDEKQIDKAINVLSGNTIGAGMTHMAKGMEFAILEMSKPENRNRNKLMFILTDGQMTAVSRPLAKSEVVFWADKARTLDCTVVSIGIGPEVILDIPLLDAAANKPSSQFRFSNVGFGDLAAIVANFSVGTECVTLVAVAQECGPLVAGTPLVISAVGMTAQAFYPEVTTFTCEYTWNEDGEDKTATTQVTFNAETEEISCPSPAQDIDNTTLVNVIYTLNNGNSNSFPVLTPILTGGSLSENCFVPPLPEEPFPYWIFFIIALLLLFLLWFFFPKMPAKKTFEETIEEFEAPQVEETIVAPVAPAHTPLPPPSLPPPKEKKKVRKWAKVDTSHYIWARDGGTARPMEVGWGATGAPESAPVKAGEVEYVTQSSLQSVVQKEEPTAAPMIPKVEEPIGDFEAEEDFEERQWDRCCCGLCRSNACDCCKKSMMASFFCCSFTGAICSKFCKPCASCYNCCDKLRPRWDCCGVNSGGGRGGNEMELNPVA